MTDALLVMPAGGWTVDDLDALPESHYRHELTDGALTVSPAPSSLHQAVAMRLGVRLEVDAPEPLVVTQAGWSDGATQTPRSQAISAPGPRCHAGINPRRTYAVPD